MSAILGSIEEEKSTAKTTATSTFIDGASTLVAPAAKGQTTEAASVASLGKHRTRPITPTSASDVR